MKAKKCWNHLLYADIIRFFLANVEGENLHIFWTTWGIWMKFSEEMWLMSQKKQGFTFFLENTFLEKHRGFTMTPPPSLFRVKEMHFPFILVEKQNHDQAKSCFQNFHFLRLLWDLRQIHYNNFNQQEYFHK